MRFSIFKFILSIQNIKYVVLIKETSTSATLMFSKYAINRNVKVFVVKLQPVILQEIN